MNFKVGPWTYAVRVSDAPLFDDVGLPAVSLTSWRERTIWICPNLPIDQRIDALFFELSRTWENHLAWPEGDEGRASWVSSFTVDAWRQFGAQGGEAALRQLGAPAPEAQPPAPRPMTVTLGAWTYEVRLAHNMEDDCGLPAASICSWEDRVIWIDDALHGEQRLDAMLYELGRMFTRHVPFPDRPEDRREWLSTFAAWARRSIDQAGGEAALAQLPEPEKKSSPGTAAA